MFVLYVFSCVLVLFYFDRCEINFFVACGIVGTDYLFFMTCIRIPFAVLFAVFFGPHDHSSFLLIKLVFGFMCDDDMYVFFLFFMLILCIDTDTDTETETELWGIHQHSIHDVYENHKIFRSCLRSTNLSFLCLFNAYSNTYIVNCMRYTDITDITENSVYTKYTVRDMLCDRDRSVVSDHLGIGNFRNPIQLKKNQIIKCKHFLTKL